MTEIALSELTRLNQGNPPQPQEQQVPHRAFSPIRNDIVGWFRKKQLGSMRNGIQTLSIGRNYTIEVMCVKAKEI